MHGQKADRERKVPILRIEKHKKKKKNKNGDWLEQEVCFNVRWFECVLLDSYWNTGIGKEENVYSLWER